MTRCQGLAFVAACLGFVLAGCPEQKPAEPPPPPPEAVKPPPPTPAPEIDAGEALDSGAEAAAPEQTDSGFVAEAAKPGPAPDANEPVKEAAKEPVKEAAKEPVKEAAKEPVKEAASEPVKEAASEPVKEAAKEPAGASAAQGAELYAKHCKACHGADGSKTKMGAKTFHALNDAAYLKSTGDAKLASIIAEGQGEPNASGKKPMPAFADKMSAAEIKSVVAFLHTLK